jgi:hypothetical protein
MKKNLFTSPGGQTGVFGELIARITTVPVGTINSRDAESILRDSIEDSTREIVRCYVS